MEKNVNVQETPALLVFYAIGRIRKDIFFHMQNGFQFQIKTYFRYFFRIYIILYYIRTTEKEVEGPAT
jgi:hypothetical protein